MRTSLHRHVIQRKKHYSLLILILLFAIMSSLLTYSLSGKTPTKIAFTPPTPTPTLIMPDVPTKGFVGETIIGKDRTIVVEPLQRNVKAVVANFTPPPNFEYLIATVTITNTASYAFPYLPSADFHLQNTKQELFLPLDLLSPQVKLIAVYYLKPKDTITLKLLFAVKKDDHPLALLYRTSLGKLDPYTFIISEKN